MATPEGVNLRTPQQAVITDFTSVAPPIALFNIGAGTGTIVPLLKRKAVGIQNKSVNVIEVSFTPTGGSNRLKAEINPGDGNGGYVEYSIDETVQVYIKTGVGLIAVTQIGE